MNRRKRRPRRGLSLLELILSVGLMAVLLAPVVGLLQTSQNVWEAYDSDHSRLEAVHATARHLTRHLRQADGIVAISVPTNTAGTISVRMPSGSTYVWARHGNRVDFGSGAATELLADQITELSFVGYMKDGVTQTTVPSQIQIVQCTAKVRLQRDENREKAITSWVWLRPWN